jgi:hypothetical protein
VLCQAWRRRQILLIIGVEIIFISKEFWSFNMFLLPLFSVNYLYLFGIQSKTPNSALHSTLHSAPHSALHSAQSEGLTQPPFANWSEEKVMKKFLCLGATFWLGQITRLIRANVCSRSWRQVITFFSLISSFYTSSKRADKHEIIECFCSSPSTYFYKYRYIYRY